MQTVGSRNLPSESAILVHIHLKDRQYRSHWPVLEIDQELRELAKASCLNVKKELSIERDRPTASHLIGRGQGEMIHRHCHEDAIDVVVMGCDLSYPQQRNLEELIGVKVIDRTQLILDIFAQRARSKEGRIQVELAQLEYLLPRLAGKGILLSRLGGGIGTRGPGEQKLEMDRRRIRQRIMHLKQQLKLIRQRRDIARHRRKRFTIPTVALVGYTNAGKSTLLNALTHAHASIEDRLFTTLDPMTRRLSLSNHKTILVTDTVGFIHQIPGHLLSAFRATLEEVTESDLIVHVLDASSSILEEKASLVHEILCWLKAEQKPILTVLNKMDLLTVQAQQALTRRYPDAICLSAKTGEGIDRLLARLSGFLDTHLKESGIYLPNDRRGWLERIYREGEVLDRKEDVKGIFLLAKIPVSLYGKLAKDGLIRD
jgi:GTP-binding protein HflX